MGSVWRKWTGAVVVVLSAASPQPELHASSGPTSTQRSGTRSQMLPQPLAAAVALLGWFGDDVPQFQLAAERPSDGTPNAEAWVRFKADGSAVPIIYVAIKSRVYRDALTDYQSLVKLAGILAHERWHLRHGPDETGAYDTQLSIMTYLRASSTELAEVRRSLNWSRQQAKNRAR